MNSSITTRIGAVLLIAMCTVTCGSSTTAPSPFIQPVPGTVTVFGTVAHPLSISRTGNMTLRLDWGDGTVDLDLFLTATSCTDIFSPLCQILTKSNASAGTSETITRLVN